MSMDYTSLVAPKGTTGSIANWVGYSKLDLPVVLDEAQSLIYSLLRVREMRTEWVFKMAVGASEAVLPARYLDPDSDVIAIGPGLRVKPKSEQVVNDKRYYDDSVSGSFGTDPFTTTANSSVVVAVQTAHGLTQGSTLDIAGSAAVGGVTPYGAFPITSIIDINTFTFDMGDTQATSGATGGGAGVTYTASVLILSTPSVCAVWDEKLKFDAAFDTAYTCKQLYFRAPALLSATNKTNFLTSRYPRLIRSATQAAAADFMKDDTEYQKAIKSMSDIITRTAQEGDLMYRGAEIGTDTP